LLRALPAARREPRSPLFRAARFLEAAALPRAARYERLMTVFSPRQRAELWGRPVAPARLLPAPAPGIAGLQRLDAETYLPGDLLPKADIASMAHSLELRSPFLDHEVVRLGVSLPESLRVRGREGKVALRRAFAADLPPLVASRGKLGFGVPLGAWFRGELGELAHDVVVGGDRGWLDATVAARLLDEHRSGRADHGHRLWCLLMLELWAREHVDAPVAVAA
jgi:asparagine synthase (glutamine-hydrolysing)